MMSLFNNNRKVQFDIDSKWSYIHDKYPPVPISKYKHEWVRHGPPARCPGFADLYKHGYVLPMWFDLEVELEGAPTWEEKEVMLTSNSAREFCTWHDKTISSIKPHLSKHDFFHSILKIHSPWRLSVPKGYCVLQTSPWFHFDKKWDVTTGVLNASYHHAVIVPLFLRLTKPVEETSWISFRAGDPLCVFIPMERKSFNLEITMDDKELKEKAGYLAQAIALRRDSHKMYREMDDLPGLVPSAKVYRDLDDEKNA